MATRNDQAALALARMQLAEMVPMAIRVLNEIAAVGEKDSDRLAAVDAILSRAGLPKSSTVDVTVDKAEHERMDEEIARVMIDMKRNQAALPAATPSPEAVFVHESESEEHVIDVPSDEASDASQA